MYVGHRGEHIPFGVFEFGEDTDRRNRRPFEDDAPSVLDDGAGYGVEVIDRNRTFEAIGAACAAGFLAFVH